MAATHTHVHLLIVIRNPPDANHIGYQLPATSYQLSVLEAGSRKLEAGSWKPEAGSWKLEAGSWKLEAGSCLPSHVRFAEPVAAVGHGKGAVLLRGDLEVVRRRVRCSRSGRR